MLLVEGVAAGGGTTLTFEVAGGRSVGVLGRDLAGLLHLAECVSGLRAPSAGRVLIGDLDIHREPDRARSAIAVNLARAAHPLATLGEHLAPIAAARPLRAGVADGIARLGLTPRTRLDTKSARSAAALAAALMTSAQVVVLHDPFRDLDESTRTKAIDWIRSLAASPSSILITGDTERDVRAVSHAVLETGARQ
jgi:ABC-type multidrug transport system ATPase subunit